MKSEVYGGRAMTNRIPSRTRGQRPAIDIKVRGGRNGEGSWETGAMRILTGTGRGIKGFQKDLPRGGKGHLGTGIGERGEKAHTGKMARPIKDFPELPVAGKGRLH